MISIFKEALDSIYHELSVVPQIVTLSDDIIFDYDGSEISESEKEDESVYCVEIIVRYKDGMEIILPVPSFCKIVTIPKYDTNTKIQYQNMNALDIGYIMKGYQHAVSIETDHFIDIENIECVEIFQNRKDDLMSVSLTGDIVKLFDAQIVSKHIDEGTFTRKLILIGKNLILEQKDEQ